MLLKKVPGKANQKVSTPPSTSTQMAAQEGKKFVVRMKLLYISNQCIRHQSISGTNIAVDIQWRKRNILHANLSTHIRSTKTFNILTCPPKLRITSFTSSLMPSSFLAYVKKIEDLDQHLNDIKKGFNSVQKPNLLADFVQPPHNKRYINNIPKSRHWKQKRTKLIFWEQPNNVPAPDMEMRKETQGDSSWGCVRTNILGQYPGRRIRNSQWE